MKDSAERFSDRVNNYARYRPGYPVKILDYLREYNFSENSVVADVGSGTGLLTELFLKNGNKTYAVEPNAEMRKMAESLLGEYKNFTSINGTAENTVLANNSADFIVVAQAFHWFDTQKALDEFKRVLKNDGVLVLIWNNRKLDTGFLIEYDDILKKYSKDYAESAHRNLSDEAIEKYFSAGFGKYSTDNFQEFGFTELLGRFSSGSYTPKEGTDEYLDSVKSLEAIFKKHQINNKITFNYDTKVYAGYI